MNQMVEPEIKSAAEVADLSRLPVIKGLSYAEKSAIQITAESKYAENTWNLNTFAYGGVSYLIRFAIKDDHGNCLTDPQFAPLLESAKDFAYMMLKRATGGSGRPSIGTVVSTVNKSLVWVIRWMMHNAVLKFSDLDADDIGRMLTYIKAAPNAIKPGEAPKVTTVAQRAFAVRYLYEHRRHLIDAIQIDPFPGTTINQWAGVTQAIKEAAKTKRIPDDIAIDMVQKALVCLRAGIKSEKYSASILRAACYIVIAALSGMRISEILSLQHNGNPRKDCIREETVEIEGVSTKLVWLYGILYKTSRDRKGRPCRWMVPPVVKEAVEMLRQLTAPIRAAGGSKHLFASLNAISKSRTVSTTTINADLDRFMEVMEVKFYQEDNDSEPEAWPIHTHQFRKTYARFMARNRFNLKMLQEHFGHVAYSMTLWYSFDGIDDELIEEIEHEATLFPEEFAESILTGKESIGGGGAAEWLAHRENYDRCKTAEDKDAYLKSLASTMVVNANGVGYCIYNPRRAMCSGGAGSGMVCVPDQCGNAIVPLQYAPVYIATVANLRELLKSRHCRSAAQQAVVAEKLDRSINILEDFTAAELRSVNRGQEVDLTRATNENAPSSRV